MGCCSGKNTQAAKGPASTVPPQAARSAPAAPAWVPKGATEELVRVAAALQGLGQDHIWAGWGEKKDDAGVLRFLGQALALDASYPGGLKAYHASARTLLAASKRGENPLAGYVPRVPEGVKLHRDCADYDELSAMGVAQVKHAAFVLVAGGLGERLGFPGIKLGLPVETATGECYLALYCAAILAWQKLSGAEAPVPLVLMTSDDTHTRTQELLREKGDFGMAEGQIVLMKQGKVPALTDGDARFAVTPGDQYALVTKPHGHGDVHQLLHQTGLAKKWRDEGRKWVIFFQDTHGLMIRKLPGQLGVSTREGFVMNSMSIGRKPGEAVGAICRLERSDGGPSVTMNVEYNQLEPMLKDTLGKGDEATEEGLSAYPGNVNTFVIDLVPYVTLLEKSGGSVPEFVNPKYTDDTRTAFKSPTRLECMMQDIAKSFPAGSKIGFTCFERYLYSPVKNATPDGAAKQAKGLAPACAASGEADWYLDGERALVLAGATVEPPPPEEDQPVYRGVRWTAGARVCLHPSFAPTLAALRGRVGGADGFQACTVSRKSTLIVRGDGVRLLNLKLDGALRIDACDGAEVVIDGLQVKNDGWPLDTIPDDGPEDGPGSCDTALRIRGYRTAGGSPPGPLGGPAPVFSALVLRFPHPGRYAVSNRSKQIMDASGSGVDTISGNHNIIMEPQAEG